MSGAVVLNRRTKNINHCFVYISIVVNDCTAKVSFSGTETVAVSGNPAAADTSVARAAELMSVIFVSIAPALAVETLIFAFKITESPAAKRRRDWIPTYTREELTPRCVAMAFVISVFLELNSLAFNPFNVMSAVTRTEFSNKSEMPSLSLQ